MTSFLNLMLVALVATGGYATDLDASTRAALASAGASTLTTEIAAEGAVVKADYEAALATFVEANATCAGIAEAAGSDCVDCIKTKCEDRGEDACSTPIGDFVQFWEEDFVDFWEQDFADFWSEDFAGFFANDFVNFFAEDFTGAFEDLGSIVEGGFVSLGEDLGTAFNAVEDFFENDFTGAFEDLGDFFANDFKDFFEKDFVNAFEDLGDWLGDIFSGKRKRSMQKREAGAFKTIKQQQRKRRASEPSCDDLKSNSSSCLYYSDACSCDFDPTTECPGYESSRQAVVDSAEQGAWIVALSESEDYSYGITKFVYDFNNFDAGKFSSCEVTMSFFGSELDFTLSQAVNMYNAAETGPIIAQQAIAEYKALF